MVFRRGTRVFRKEVKTSGTSFGDMEMSFLLGISHLHNPWYKGNETYSPYR